MTVVTVNASGREERQEDGREDSLGGALAHGDDRRAGDGQTQRARATLMPASSGAIRLDSWATVPCRGQRSIRPSYEESYWQRSEAFDGCRQESSKSAGGLLGEHRYLMPAESALSRHCCTQAVCRHEADHDEQADEEGALETSGHPGRGETGDAELHDGRGQNWKRRVKGEVPASTTQNPPKRRLNSTAQQTWARDLAVPPRRPRTVRARVAREWRSRSALWPRAFARDLRIDDEGPKRGAPG